MPHAPYATDWGPGWVSWDSEGIDAVRLPGSVLPADTALIAPPEVTELCGVLGRYFAGRGDLPDGRRFAAVAGSTPSTRRIYEVVASIPRGATMTYATVAAAVGRPGAARAVGAAMAANRFPPVIPCHRVVGSDGTLRGYAGGLEMKLRMLVMEGAR